MQHTEVIPETVGQHTGIKDFFNIPIYHHDLLNIGVDEGNYHVDFITNNTEK